MDRLERVLDERSADFSSALALVGFSPDEASRFLAIVRPELIRSYEWHVATTGEAGRPAVAAGDVLSSIRGRALASEVGISDAKTWAGLRELVPAVLEASRPPPRRRHGERDAVARFEVGFGLTLDRLRVRRSRAGDGPATEPPIGARHPIFGHLLCEE